jgi:predicted ATPase
MYRREEHLIQEHTETLFTLSTEQGFPDYVAAGTIWRGWILIMQGRPEEGIARMHEGLAAYLATGAALQCPSILVLLAETYGKRGQIVDGLAVIEEALTVVEKTGERFYEAEVYRIKGELTFLSTVHGPKSQVEKEAEEHFHKAIEIARRQQAKSLELRAATSLARVWQQQGKSTEAHRMLSEIYNWYTEGFDTKDLQEAKALIEALTH